MVWTDGLHILKDDRYYLRLLHSVKLSVVIKGERFFMIKIDFSKFMILKPALQRTLKEYFGLKRKLNTLGRERE